MSKSYTPGEQVAVHTALHGVKHGTVQRLFENKVYVKHFDGTIIAYRPDLVESARVETAARPQVNIQEEADIIRSILEGKPHTIPKTAKEKDLAALAHPKDKITHKDVMVGRGVIAKEESEIDEELNLLESLLDEEYLDEGILDTIKKKAGDLEDKIKGNFRPKRNDTNLDRVKNVLGKVEDKIKGNFRSKRNDTNMDRIKNAASTVKTHAIRAASKVGLASRFHPALKKEELEIDEEMKGEMHPDASKVLKHIKPEHQGVYKPFLKKGVYKGNYQDRAAVLSAAEKAGHLKEDVDLDEEQLDELTTDTLHSYLKGREGQTGYVGAKKGVHQSNMMNLARKKIQQAPGSTDQSTYVGSQHAKYAPGHQPARVAATVRKKTLT